MLFCQISHKLGQQHHSGRVTENRCGQNMISRSDSQLLMMNARQKRAKYAERPSPCQSWAATQMLDTNTSDSLGFLSRP